MAISRALISVSNKVGIVEFAKKLHKLNIEIISTGGSAKLLQDNKIPVVEISNYTGFQEMMDGRVKTLHPKIHGGILARRGIDDKVMNENNIQPIDLVIVNLYPFQETVSKVNCTLENAIENIDIGGPTMLRAAAKNYQDVTVVIDSNDYKKVLAEIEKNGSTSKDTRFYLAKKVFEHTAKYDGAIANYLGKNEDGFADTINLQLIKKQIMRYGENPHQKAAFYVEDNKSVSIAHSTIIQGKELSFNNINDADAALECVRSFEKPACVIVKHANPCGVAVADDIYNAYLNAYETDPISAFGGIIAFNKNLDAKISKKILTNQFVEVIIAPKIDAAAKNILKDKKKIRVLECGKLEYSNKELDYKRVTSGLLVQDKDLKLSNKDTIQCVTKNKGSRTLIDDLLFAFIVVKFVKSNAIVYAKNNTTIGIGAGQMSRVYAAKIAQIKAKNENLIIKDCVMASDAFFPFRDSIDEAHKAGVKAIIQPGGSINDKEIIAACDEYNIAMFFTNIRHFKH